MNALVGVNGNLVLNQDDISYTLNGIYSQYFSRIRGSLTGSVEWDALNPGNNALRLHGAYTFPYRINRKLTLYPGIQFAFTSNNADPSSNYLRYNFNQRETTFTSGSSHQNNFNTDASLLLSARRFQMGYQISNLLATPLVRINDTTLIEPLRHSAIVSLNLITGTKYTLNSTFVAQYQAGSLRNKISKTYYFDGTTYLHSGVHLRTPIWSFGIGHRYYDIHSHSYHASVGRKFGHFEIFYNLGLNFSQPKAGQIHQFNAMYSIITKHKPVSFRTISCPSFGGQPSYARRYNLNRKGAQNGSVNTQHSLHETVANEKDAQQSIQAGQLTAGEINDFAKWTLWADIVEKDLLAYRKQWRIDPRDRVCVRVSDSTYRPVCNAEVILRDTSGSVIWSARTDNTGKAELWANMETSEQHSIGSITVKKGQAERSVDRVLLFSEGINDVQIDLPCAIPNSMDIVFAVDATGSMGDEINYLKKDLVDIIQRAQKGSDRTAIRLGSLFYRCAGNSYVTKAVDLSNDLDTVERFINQQTADEGGDEALEIALDECVNQLSWDANARARLLFVVLDEAPGSADSILLSLQQTIRSAAAKGIRIIPLVASGMNVNADKSLEYLMRCMALYTNGTYAFLTDDSGIGNSHTKPSVDEYEVEQLTALLLRLIDQFSAMPQCDEVPPFPAAKPDSSVLQVLSMHEVRDSLHYDGNDSADSQNPADSVRTRLEPYINQISIYPNPSTGTITINNSAGIDAVYLCDQNGKILQRIELVPGETQVSLSQHPPGNYYLQYHGEKRRFETRLVLLK